MKMRRAIVVLLVAILFSFGIFCGLQVSRWSGIGATAGRTFSTPALLKQVQSLSELVTVKYVIEKAEVWTDPPQNVIAQFVAGDNHVLLLAHGIVKAGVNLQQLKPDDLQIREKTLIIKLPPADVTDAFLDDTQTKVIERKTGFLRTFDKDLEQTIRRIAVEDIRLAALRGGIRQEADERARAQLRALFLQLGFDKVEFQ